MTREDQIEYQASEYANDPDNTIEWGDGWEDFDQVFDAFKNGAKWADENPKFSKEEFIDKACEWIQENVNKYSYVMKVEDTEYRKVHFTDSLIDDFRKAMEE